MSLAVDKEAVVSKIRENTKIANRFIPPASYGYDETSIDYPYDKKDKAEVLNHMNGGDF